MSEPVLTSTFFDNPNLLAVRFKQQGVATPRVVQFATTRMPDALPAGCGAIGATILVGMALVAIGYGLFASSSSSPSWSSSSSPSSYSSPGSTDYTVQQAPRPTVDSAVAADSQKNTAWNVKLTHLGDDLAPREELKPWYVRALLDIPRGMAQRGDATGGWLKPRCAEDEQAAYRRGRELATMLWDAGADRGTALVFDLPGPLSVAAAAGVSEQFEPVFTIDNVPHPYGVVPSAQTLASVVYWYPDLIQNKSKRRKDASPAFILEGARLSPYNNEAERFDNRSAARLPDVEGFKKLGITRILYIRRNRGTVTEADDLNDLFLACAKADIEVRYMALETIDRTDPQPTAERPIGTLPPGPRLWFWRNYGWGRPADMNLPSADDTDASYRAVARPAPVPSFNQLDGGRQHENSAVDYLTGSAPAVSTGSSPSTTSSGATSSHRPSSTSSYHPSSSNTIYRPSTTSSSRPSSSSSSGGSRSRSSFSSSSG